MRSAQSVVGNMQRMSERQCCASVVKGGCECRVSARAGHKIQQQVDVPGGGGGQSTLVRDPLMHPD